MKKCLNIFMTFLILFSMFAPFFPESKVEAAGTYSVVMVSGTAGNQTVGTYSTYAEAVNVMNEQDSTSTSVATIYKDGVVINSRYAIFKLHPSTGTYNVYQELSDTSAYTYINPSSMLDTAFIDYDESKNMVQIMVNGFKGWITADAGTITPISLYSANMIEINASGLNFRSGPSTSSPSIGSITCSGCQFTYTSKQTTDKYTWYKITYNNQEGWVAGDPSWLQEVTGNSLNTYYYRYDNGNLLHRFAYHTGTTESDYFTNLGPSPDYLSVGTHYYSFDGGIYLYTSLTAMLDDYRNDTYTNALNKDDPNYPYYLFVPAKTISKATAEDLDAQITDTSSKMYGSGAIFKEVEAMYGVNALSMFSVAKTESSSGTSKIAKEKNNLFGMGAYDSCAYECATEYASIKDSIIDYAKQYLDNYATAGASYYFGSHQGNKGSGRNVKYASDPLSGEKAAASAYITDKNTNDMKDYKSNTIAVSKYGKSNIVVYKDASTDTPIYTMQNSNSSFEVYNVSVNVIDKEGDFYKIYTDSNDYQYGYVKVSDFNITNNQPVINASDKTISLDSSFDPLDGVTATDSEDGDLTSSITYSGEVNTAKTGEYEITYKVTDSSNFSATKTITITVEGANEPIINASDKEVSQYTEFDYMDGVSASIGDTDITDKITYEGEVDTDETGEYEITYKVTTDEGQEVSKTVTITVIENQKPEITATNTTVYLNGEYDPLDGVTATDSEDGDLTSSIEVVKNEVKTDQIGDYTVIYSVTDSAGQTVTKEITVTVAEKVLEQASGWFHIEEISFNNDYMKISGYEIITGISNSPSDDISYELILVNQDTNEKIIFNLDRWIDDVPYVPNDGSSNDYSGSWFTGNIDLSEISDGDYTMYIKASSDWYYSLDVVSNVEYSDNLERKYEGTDGTGYAVRENKTLASIDLELFVRSEGLITYGTTPVWSGLYSDLFSYSLDGYTLNLVGTSYALKTDYKESDEIKREIVFEDKETHKIVYTQEIGSTVDGVYSITSNTNNDMTRAWFNANINLSSLDEGTYVIYIRTKNGDVDDYSELADTAYSDLSETTEVDGKTISLKRINDKRIRLELVIE